MEKIISIIMVALFSLLFTASSSHAGYRNDPWGSRTWEGPGRPPHWSPETRPKNTKPPKPTPYSSPEHRGTSEPGIGATDNHREKGGYWKDKHNRWNYHRSRRSGYIYYREPKVETVIIEQQKPAIVYKPAVLQPSRQQCGGKTISRRNPETGTLIIEYVTAAQECQ